MKNAFIGAGAMLFASLGLFLLAFYWFPSIFSRAASPNGRDTALPRLIQHAIVVDPQITQITATSSAMIDVLIYMDKPSIPQPNLRTSRIGKNTLRTQYVNKLRELTTKTQQLVRASFSTAEKTRHITISQTFFVDNVFLARIDATGLAALMRTPGIRQIIPNRTIILDPGTRAAATVPEWNLDKIEVPKVWNELGLTGNGITIANIDTGVQWDHPALKTKYRGWNGTLASHDYNWYDPSNTSPLVPLDNTGHGTHTMGIMVGSDETHTIGVAPNAQWIAVKGCVNNSCSQSDLLAAGQWILAPTKTDGTNPDPSKAPDVVNNSWGGTRCQNWFSGVVDSWNAAGIFSVFAAGNEGPNSNTVGSPADYESVLSVGSVDSSNVVATLSSRGPSCATFGERIKPELVAPGVSILSSIPYDGYLALSGTSMAAPHIAGVAALLLQSQPSRTPYEIGYILQHSTLDLGSTGMDNAYGMGLINAYTALTLNPTVIPTPTPTPLPPSLQVTSPNGGEIVQFGQTVPITWSSTGIATVYINLIDAVNNTSRIIAMSIPNSNRYDWTISFPVGTYTSKYKIEIESFINGGNTRIYDQSDSSFTILGIPTPTPQPSPTKRPTPTLSPSPTPTITPTPTKRPTPTPTPVQNYCSGPDGSSCTYTSCPVCTTRICPQQACTIKPGTCFHNLCR